MNSKSFKMSSFDSKQSRQALLNRPWHTMCNLKCNPTSQEVLHRTRSVPASDPASSNAFPPPKHFQRKAKQVRNAGSISDAAPIVVSADRHHRLLHISNELSERLGFQPSEICGRMLGVLQGPKTDAKTLLQAVKSACMLVPAECKVILYSREGVEHSLAVSCWPITSEFGEVTGCGIHIGAPSSGPRRPVLPFHAAAAAAEAEKLRRVNRALYNFRTGLAIQSSHRKCCIPCR
jgi:hypothetical protein